MENFTIIERERQTYTVADEEKKKTQEDKKKCELVIRNVVNKINTLKLYCSLYET